MNRILCYVFLGFLGFSTACDGQSNCDPDLLYPRCNAAGVIERCYDEQVFAEQDCESGTVCLSGSFSDGEAWAACVRPGAEACDMDLHVPVCQNEQNIWVCSSVGYTLLISCPEAGEGLVCKTSSLRAACTPPDAMSCDPASYEEICDGNQATYCDPELGFVIAREACAAPRVCKVGTEGPVCVAADSEPCDYLDYLPSCVENERQTCYPSTAFTELRPCAADEQCLESAVWPGSKCFDANAVFCDRANFAMRCEGVRQVICNAFDVEELIDCGAGETCLLSSLGGFCVESGAELCDPESYEASCDGDSPLICDAQTGFTRHRAACQPPKVCKSAAYGPFCVDADSQPCAQDEYGCDGADLVFCLNGFTERYTCEEGLICVLDDFAWIFGMSCVDPSAPVCEVSDPVICDGATGQRCAGGYESAFDCGEGNLCATDGSYFLCLQEDNPTCDPLSYDTRCQENDLYQCWDPGLELQWTCPEGYACVEDENGAGCVEM